MLAIKDWLGSRVDIAKGVPLDTRGHRGLPGHLFTHLFSRRVNYDTGKYIMQNIMGVRPLGKKLKNGDLGENMKRGKEKRRKIASKTSFWVINFKNLKRLMAHSFQYKLVYIC